MLLIINKENKFIINNTIYIFDKDNENYIIKKEYVNFY